MPSARFFGHLGMFVAPGFIDAVECSSLRREMQLSPTTPAGILDGKKNQLTVDEGERRTEAATVSPETRALIAARLMAIRPSLEKRFGVELAGCEPPSFLVYKEGFYFLRHTDASRNPEAPVKFRQRRVTVSIFLNGEGGENQPDTYGGGSIIFHRSPIAELDTKHPGLALTGEEGLLIGFDSFWPHEVQPISRGTRYSIVTWFA